MCTEQSRFVLLAYRSKYGLGIASHLHLTFPLHFTAKCRVFVVVTVESLLLRGNLINKYSILTYWNVHKRRIVDVRQLVFVMNVYARRFHIR